MGSPITASKVARTVGVVVTVWVVLAFIAERLIVAG
jgi:hypothetical protein